MPDGRSAGCARCWARTGYATSTASGSRIDHEPARATAHRGVGRNARPRSRERLGPFLHARDQRGRPGRDHGRILRALRLGLSQDPRPRELSRRGLGLHVCAVHRRGHAARVHRPSDRFVRRVAIAAAAASHLPSAGRTVRRDPADPAPGWRRRADHHDRVLAPRRRGEARRSQRGAAERAHRRRPGRARGRAGRNRRDVRRVRPPARARGCRRHLLFDEVGEQRQADAGAIPAAGPALRPAGAGGGQAPVVQHAAPVRGPRAARGDGRLPGPRVPLGCACGAQPQPGKRPGGRAGGGRRRRRRANPRPRLTGGRSDQGERGDHADWRARLPARARMLGAGGANLRGEPRRAAACIGSRVTRRAAARAFPSRPGR